MRRHTTQPRPDWQKRVEQTGLTYHSMGGSPYWDESAYWELSSAEVDLIEAATSEIQRLCLAAGDHIVEKNRFAEMCIPPEAIPHIIETWEQEPPALYGRIDLAYDGNHLKLLEYNADTPTSLVEASVTQWCWLQDCFPQTDQFNSIHEKLIAKWRDLLPYIKQPVYFGYEPVEEDRITIEYLRDTANQASLRSAAIAMHDIGWQAAANQFVDLGKQPMHTIFKLYPWETLLKDAFGPHALAAMRQTQWIEPIWKMLWSNKALLAILWELFPNHELLLPAFLDGIHLRQSRRRRVCLSEILRPGHIWQNPCSPRKLAHRRRTSRHWHPRIRRLHHHQHQPLRPPSFPLIAGSRQILR